MSISSSSFDVSSFEDDFTVNTPRRVGRLLKRTFVHLQTRLTRAPTRVQFNRLRGENRVADISFTRNTTELEMKTSIENHLPSMRGLQFDR